MAEKVSWRTGKRILTELNFIFSLLVDFKMRKVTVTLQATLTLFLGYGSAALNAAEFEI